jgi:hypothetical protein
MRAAVGADAVLITRWASYTLGAEQEGLRRL